MRIKVFISILCDVFIQMHQDVAQKCLKCFRVLSVIASSLYCLFYDTWQFAVRPSVFNTILSYHSEKKKIATRPFDSPIE